MAPVEYQDLQRKVGIRPTLLIGLGGTGQKVLVQIKARFQKNYGFVPKDIKFLAFDTDPNAEKASLGDKPITLLPDRELINIGGIEPTQILANLDRHPAIAAWITEDKERIPAQAIVAGAKQVRPLGRLSLFWKAETVYNKVQEAFNSLTHLDVDISDAINQQTSTITSLNVFIISSVCGGTGSGAVLDVAYLVRRALEQANISSSFCYINAVLALPSVFPNVEKIGIDSNAFACLSELDYFMEGGDWKVDYGNPRVGKVEFYGRPPFNICYLVGAKNEQGRGLTGIEEIAPMIAEAVYLQISSQVGVQNNSGFDNVDVLSGRIEERDTQRMRTTAYSSFGTAALLFPFDKILNRLSNELGQNLIKNYLLKDQGDEVRVKAEVQRFLEAEQLEEKNLLQEVARDPKGNVMLMVMNPETLNQFKDNDLMQRTEQYFASLQTKLDNEYNKALEINKGILTQRLVDHLKSTIKLMMNTPEQGLHFAVRFLDALSATLNGTKNDLSETRRATDAKAEAVNRTLPTHRTNFAGAFRSFIIGRAGTIRDGRNAYVGKLNEYLNLRYDARKREIAVALLAGLTATLQEQRTAVQTTIDRLQLAQGQFETHVTRMKDALARGNENVLAVEITDEKDIKKFYDDHFTALGDAPAAQLLEREGPFSAWMGLDQAALVAKILSYTRSVFQDICDVTIEGEVLRKRDEINYEKRMQDLINRSVPFWTYRKEIMSSDWRSKTILVEGVQDRETSIYKEFRSGLEGTEESRVSTFDPHSIVVLQTKHGLPLFALTPYGEYRTAHDNVLRTGQKPLYVFPEVRPGGERAKQLFALGLTYGMIFKSGYYYYVLPVDPSHAPIKLEQGMSESLRSFRTKEELYRQVEAMVEDQVSKDGVAAAQSLLNEYIRESYVYEFRKGGMAKVTGADIKTDSMNKDTSVSKPGTSNYDLTMELRDTIKIYVRKLQS